LVYLNLKIKGKVINQWRLCACMDEIKQKQTPCKPKPLYVTLRTLAKEMLMFYTL